MAGPEPIDAEKVYQNSIQYGEKTWYGVSENGKIYRYFSDNVGTTHFSGYVTKDNIPNEILKQLGLKY